MTGQLPIYQQIELLLKQKISAGEYPANQALPSERKLAELYGVNRLTVRAALKQLQAQGIIIPVHGKGNFVRSFKLRKNFSNFAGFGSDLKAFHFKLTNQVVMANRICIGYELSQKMALPEGTQVFRLMRLRLGDGQPFALEDAYVPFGLIPDIESVDFAEQSLYTAFENNGVHLNYSRQLLSATRLGPYIAEIMGLPCGGETYRVEYTTFDRSDRLAEYTISYLNPRLAVVASHLR